MVTQEQKRDVENWLAATLKEKKQQPRMLRWVTVAIIAALLSLFVLKHLDDAEARILDYSVKLGIVNDK